VGLELIDATFNFAGQSLTEFVNSSNTYWSTVEFEFREGTGFLSLDWAWDALDTHNRGRLAVQRIEIFEDATETPPILPSPSSNVFSIVPSYTFDFSSLQGDRLIFGHSASWSTIHLSSICDYVRHVNTNALHSDLDLLVVSGTLRMGVNINDGNTFIDPNGRDRGLLSNGILTGPIRVVITARNATANERAYATFKLGNQSVTQFVNASNITWSSTTFDFEDGQGLLTMQWPWYPINEPGQGRLAIQSIRIFEGVQQQQRSVSVNNQRDSIIVGSVGTTAFDVITNNVTSPYWSQAIFPVTLFDAPRGMTAGFATIYQGGVGTLSIGTTAEVPVGEHLVRVSINGVMSTDFIVSVDGDGRWVEQQTPQQGNGWSSITYGNGMFIAVSNQGASGSQAMTSPDGINWTLRSTPGANQVWSSVTFGNGLFIAVSYYGITGSQVMTSPDGINWTLRSTPEPIQRWNSVTYGNGLFVAVSSSGTEGSQVMASSDGINWTLRSTPSSNQRWRSVAFGNGLFVAVSSGGNHTSQPIMTSLDGENWTLRTVSTTEDLSLNSITFGNGLFVAVSQASNSAGAQAAISSNGIDWALSQITPIINLKCL